MERPKSLWSWVLRRIWIPQAITVVMLLIALNPSNPYGYYVLLRWVCCAACGYLVVQALAQDKQALAWALGVTAVVYNPIVRVHLTRGTWTVINIVTIGIAIASVAFLESESDSEV